MYESGEKSSVIATINWCMNKAAEPEDLLDLIWLKNIIEVIPKEHWEVYINDVIDSMSDCYNVENAL